MTKILKGKPVREAIGDEIRRIISADDESAVKPRLKIVRVGDNPADAAYERGIRKSAEKFGIEVATLGLPLDITTKELKGHIVDLNTNEEVDGMLLFRPLPEHIDEKEVLNAMDMKKDVDGAARASLAEVFSDGEEGFRPCTAEAVVNMLEKNNIDVDGSNITIIGRSLVVGKPLCMMLLKRGATVTLCHSRTRDMKKHIKDADIIIVAIGRANFIGREYFDDDAGRQVVIDVGINPVEGGIVGDVDYKSLIGTVGAVTPVPGGIGAVTNLVMLKHVCESAVKNKRG